MAWLSVGTSNEDLCSKLRSYGVLQQEGKLMSAFLATDRGDFVVPGDREQAYHDRPYRRDSIHISAPHMYVTVLEALDLQEGHSFLNIGSGSGYLCCLAAHLVGENGVVQGVEVSGAAVSHSRRCCAAWRERVRQPPTNLHFQPNFVQITEGNIFDLDVVAQASRGRFDRIYIGAAVSAALRDVFLALLRDDGVLLAPIQDTNHLVKVTRVYGDVFEQTTLSAVHFAPLQPPLQSPQTLAQQLPGVYLHHHFAAQVDDEEANEPYNDRHSVEQAALRKVWSLAPENMLVVPSSLPRDVCLSAAGAAADPAVVTVAPPFSLLLPAESWRPSSDVHRRFPPDFRRAVYSLLLCVSLHHRCHTDEHRRSRCSRDPRQRVPVAVWLHVVSFMTRDWFAPAPTDAQLLRAEFVAERRMRRVAEHALSVSEKLRRAAERERDALKASLAQHQRAAGNGTVDLMQRRIYIDLDEEEDDDEYEDGDGDDEDEQVDESSEGEMSDEEYSSNGNEDDTDDYLTEDTSNSSIAQAAIDLEESDDYFHDTEEEGATSGNDMHSLGEGDSAAGPQFDPILSDAINIEAATASTTSQVITASNRQWMTDEHDEVQSISQMTAVASLDNTAATDHCTSTISSNTAERTSLKRQRIDGEQMDSRRQRGNTLGDLTDDDYGDAEDNSEVGAESIPVCQNFTSCSTV